MKLYSIDGKEVQGSSSAVDGMGIGDGFFYFGGYGWDLLMKDIFIMKKRS